MTTTEINLLKELEAMQAHVIKPFTREEVETLTYEQAREVLHEARRCLCQHLLIAELHDHLEDDCGDYINGATTNWVLLFEAHFNGSNESFVEDVKKFLLAPSEPQVDEITGEYVGDFWEACDGEIRYDLVPWNNKEEES